MRKPQYNQIYGVVEGSIPVTETGGAPTTEDVYTVECTTGGVSATAQVTITSNLADNVVAGVVTSGVPVNLGVAGGTLTLTFEYLHSGDRFVVRTHATGEIDFCEIHIGDNWEGAVIPIAVNPDGELRVNLEVSDIEIGAVEIKDADSDNRADVHDADTARATTTHVLAVQNIDAEGHVPDWSDLDDARIATEASQAALEIMDDWDELDRAKVNPVVGQAGVSAGTGIIDASTQRVTVATDDTNLSAIKTAIELLDDLQGALKSIDTDELITRITDSAGVEINPAKEDGNLAAILAAFEAGMAIPDVTHRSPKDFTATYTSSTTFKLAGLSLVISIDPQIVFVLQTKADNTSKLWLHGINCTLTEVGGVVTIHEAGTPFVVGDQYVVGIMDQDKGYDSTQDAYKSLEQSPAKDWWTDFVDYTTFVPDTVAYAEGVVIDVGGKTDINFAWSKTASDADNNYIKVIYLDDSGSAVDYQEVSIGSPVGGVTQVVSNVYEVDKAADVNALQFPTKGFPFMRIDISKATDTGTDSTWTTKINKRWR